MSDYDYECISCGHRITLPFDVLRPPTKCEKCGDTHGYLSKEIIEENELINAIDAKEDE